MTYRSRKRYANSLAPRDTPSYEEILANVYQQQAAPAKAVEPPVELDWESENKEVVLKTKQSVLDWVKQKFDFSKIELLKTKLNTLFSKKNPL